MIRVFQKKGLAMTDEQFLAVAFGTDILTKGAMIFQLVKQNRKLMDMWKEQSNFTPKAQASKQSTTPPPPPSEPTQSTTPPPPTPQPSQPTTTFVEPEEFSAESMVSDMMGMKESATFENVKQTDGMPQFGDPSMLKKLDELSKKEAKAQVIDVTPQEEETKKEAPKKRKRGRPRKNK